MRLINSYIDLRDTGAGILSQEKVTAATAKLTISAVEEEQQGPGPGATTAGASDGTVGMDSIHDTSIVSTGSEMNVATENAEETGDDDDDDDDELELEQDLGHTSLLETDTSAELEDGYAVKGNDDEDNENGEGDVGEEDDGINKCSKTNSGMFWSFH